jgi:hypothetical protein
MHPDNGDHISASAPAALKIKVVFERTETKVSSKATSQPTGSSIHQDASGKPLVEHWQVSQGGYCLAQVQRQARTPSASTPRPQAMVAFFMQHSQSLTLPCAPVLLRAAGCKPL